MDSDNVMTVVHEYTITNEIRIFILDITFNITTLFQFWPIIWFESTNQLISYS